MPRVIEVIECEVKRGKGTDDDLIRLVKQYWTLDGKTLLAENDPCDPKKGAYLGGPVQGDGTFDMSKPGVGEQQCS